MIPKGQRQTRLIIVIVLFGLLPGFPLLLILSGVTFTVAGLSQHAFLPMLKAHNFYYSLPAAIFGQSLFPAEEFGLLPTFAGYVVAAILYALIAIALSFPVCWLFRVQRAPRLRQRT
jgi:hypothetical protein